MMMRWIMDVLRGNVREARKYATKAHELRDKNRQAADWCCDMADAHLKFNDGGMSMAQSFMEQMPQNYMLGYAFSSKLIEKSGDKNVYIYKNAQKFSDGVEQVGLYKMLNFKDNGEFNIVKYAPQNSMFLFELSINGAGLYDFIQWCVENKFNGSLMETETSLIGDNNEVDIAAMLASVDGRLGVYAAPITAKDGKTLCQVAIMVPDGSNAPTLAA